MTISSAGGLASWRQHAESLEGKIQRNNHLITVKHPEIFVRKIMSSLLLYPNTSSQPCCKASPYPTWYWTRRLCLPCYSLSIQYPTFPCWAMSNPRTASTRLFAFCVLYSLFPLTLDSHSFLPTPTSVFLHSPFLFSVPLFCLSLLPIHHPNSNSQPWQCPQTNYLI